MEMAKSLQTIAQAGIQRCSSRDQGDTEINAPPV